MEIDNSMHTGVWTQSVQYEKRAALSPEETDGGHTGLQEGGAEEVCESLLHDESFTALYRAKLRIKSAKSKKLFFRAGGSSPNGLRLRRSPVGTAPFSGQRPLPESCSTGSGPTAAADFSIGRVQSRASYAGARKER